MTSSSMYTYILVIATMSSRHLLAQVRTHDVVHLTSLYIYITEEDGTRHVINDFIWEMSIRTISTKVEDVSHKNL